MNAAEICTLPGLKFLISVLQLWNECMLTLRKRQTGCVLRFGAFPDRGHGVTPALTVL